MATDMKAFAEEINQSRLTIEEGRIVFILSNGSREEHPVDGEVEWKVGMGILSDGSINWVSNGKKKYKESYDIKSVNGIAIAKYKK